MRDSQGSKSVERKRLRTTSGLSDVRSCAEVVVSFTGKIVWSIDPNDPNFGTQVPSLRGETKGVRVVCSADIMHACGFVCLDGVLREAAKKQ